MKKDIAMEVMGLYQELGGREDITEKEFPSIHFLTKISLVEENLLYVSNKHLDDKSMGKFLLSHFEDRVKLKHEFEYSVFKIGSKFVFCYPKVISGAEGPDTFGTYFSFYNNKEELKQTLTNWKFSQDFINEIDTHDFSKRRGNRMEITQTIEKSEQENDFSGNMTSSLSSFAQKLLNMRYNAHKNTGVESDIKPK